MLNEKMIQANEMAEVYFDAEELQRIKAIDEEGYMAGDRLEAKV
jgi:hypothetical protein